ncbi:hypothetical protein ABZ281_02270 [Streptomyces sp. NPDC006265]|uniref:hypothetical protein n=1 Tax=Streptomyces sp. NPDC006265 TaxID=3156740 RepID=UPI0033BE8966
MGTVHKRPPGWRRLAKAAFCLTMLAVASWFMSEMVSADFPRRPFWDLGTAGPWVASYAHAVAVGSWMAACACLLLAGLVLALDSASRVVSAVRGGTRR